MPLPRRRRGRDDDKSKRAGRSCRIALAIICAIARESARAGTLLRKMCCHPTVNNLLIVKQDYGIICHTKMFLQRYETTSLFIATTSISLRVYCETAPGERTRTSSKHTECAWLPSPNFPPKRCKMRTREIQVTTRVSLTSLPC